MTHVVKGQLKGVMEEADKKKALKQVAKATLKEKVLELATTDRRAIFVERTWELAKQKVEALQGKLEEAKTKLAEAASTVSA